jgi:hypothetical protein
LNAVPAFHSSARCSCLIYGTQAQLIGMVAILMLAYGLFCELCSQFECPSVAARCRGLLLLPVLGLEL